MKSRRARRWRILAVVAVGAILVVAGCREKEDPIPSGTFRMVVEDEIADDVLLVKRVSITAPGTRVVTISEKGGLDQIRVEPDSETGLATVQAIFVADLIRFQSRSENVLRWMVRMKSGGATVGGPGLSSVGSAQTLQDVLGLNLRSGLYALSQGIPLGRIQDRELILTVR